MPIKKVIKDENRGLLDKIKGLNYDNLIRSAYHKVVKSYSTYSEIQKALINSFLQSEFAEVMRPGPDSTLSEFRNNQEKIDLALTKYAEARVDSIKPAVPESEKVAKIAEEREKIEASESQRETAIFELYKKEVLGTEAYKYAVSEALPIVAKITESMLLEKSKISNKLNYDLIASAGRNLTFYHTEMLSDEQLKEVLEGKFDWKKFLKEQSNIILQDRGGNKLGAFVGGLANTIDFGDDEKTQEENIQKFVTWIAKEDTIKYTANLINKVAPKNKDISDTDLKAIASELSIKLSNDIPNVTSLWTPLETIVKTIKKHSINAEKSESDVSREIDVILKSNKLVDNLKYEKGKYTLLSNEEVIKNNIFREGEEELDDLSKDHRAGKDANKLKIVDNKLFAIKFLKENGVDERRELLIGGEVFDSEGNLIGLSRDPQFPNQVGFDARGNEESGVVIFAVPECYVNKVLPGQGEKFKSEIAKLSELKGKGEMKGAKSSNLWDAAKYAASVVNQESGRFTPQGGGYVLDPSFDKTEIFAYHHEAQVALAAATRTVSNASIAAVVNSKKEEFLKSVEGIQGVDKEKQETIFKEFIANIQDLGFTRAASKYYTDSKNGTSSINIEHTYLAKFITENKNAIESKSKDVFTQNFLGEKGAMTELSNEYKDVAFNLDASAKLIYWQTNDPLLCLARNYFGKDANLYGEEFIKKALGDASSYSTEMYQKNHPDKFDKVLLASEVPNSEIRVSEVIEIEKKFLDTEAGEEVNFHELIGLYLTEVENHS